MLPPFNVYVYGAVPVEDALIEPVEFPKQATFVVVPVTTGVGFTVTATDAVAVQLFAGFVIVTVYEPEVVAVAVGFATALVKELGPDQLIVPAGAANVILVLFAGTGVNEF